MIVRIEDSEGKHINFHEGRHIGYHWRDETDELTKGIIIVIEDSNGGNAIEVLVESGDNNTIYLMNDNGKTIDRLRIT